MIDAESAQSCLPRVEKASCITIRIPTNAAAYLRNSIDRETPSLKHISNLHPGNAGTQQATALLHYSPTDALSCRARCLSLTHWVAINPTPHSNRRSIMPPTRHFGAEKRQLAFTIAARSNCTSTSKICITPANFLAITSSTA